MRTPYQLATTPQGTAYVTADAQVFNQRTKSWTLPVMLMNKVKHI